MAKEVKHFSSHPGHGEHARTVAEHDPNSAEGMDDMSIFNENNHFGLKSAPGVLGKHGYLTRG